MSELTKEYFDTKLQGIDNKLQGFDTKFQGFDNRLHSIDDKIVGLDQKINGLDTKISKLATKDEVEELARMVNNGFEDLKTRLDVTGRVTVLETDMGKIKGALQIT